MYDARRRTDQDEAGEQEPNFEDHDAEAADYYKDQAIFYGNMLPLLPYVLGLHWWLLLMLASSMLLTM